MAILTIVILLVFCIWSVGYAIKYGHAKYSNRRRLVPFYQTEYYNQVKEFYKGNVYKSKYFLQFCILKYNYDKNFFNGNPSVTKAANIFESECSMVIWSGGYTTFYYRGKANYYMEYDTKSNTKAYIDNMFKNWLIDVFIYHDPSIELPVLK
jgi:hypothetical protein